MRNNISFDDNLLINLELDKLQFYLFKTNIGRRLGGNTYKIGELNNKPIIYFELAYKNNVHKIFCLLEHLDNIIYFIDNLDNSFSSFDELKPLLDNMK